MTKFLISCKESRIETNRSFYSSFIVGPFHASESITLANTIRRSLLSELSGIAIISVQIEGVAHEYSNLPGIKDSVLDILLNLREIVLKKLSKTMRPQVGYLRVRGPGTVYARDLCLPPFIQCVDPEQYIATLADNGVLNMKFIITEGNNYLKGKPKMVIDFYGFKKRRLILKKINHTCLNSSLLKNYYNYLKRKLTKKLSNVSLSRARVFLQLNPKDSIEMKNDENQKNTTLEKINHNSILDNSLSFNLLNIDAVFNPIINVNSIIEINEHKVLENLFNKSNKIENQFTIVKTKSFLQSYLKSENLEKKLRKSKKLLTNGDFLYLRKLLNYQINFIKFKNSSNNTSSNLIKSSNINRAIHLIKENVLKEFDPNNSSPAAPSLPPALAAPAPASLPSPAKQVWEAKGGKATLARSKGYKSSICLAPQEPEQNVQIWSNELKKDNIFHNNVILEIWTNGSLHPRDAIYQAFTSLIKLFSKLKTIKSIEPFFKSQVNNIHLIREFKNNSNNLFPLSPQSFLGKYTGIQEYPLKNTENFFEKYKLNKKDLINKQTLKDNLKKKSILSSSSSSFLFSNRINKKKLKKNNSQNKKLVNLKKSTSNNIEILKISLRTLILLKKKNINTIQDLVQLTKKDLLNIPNIGKKSLEEIEKSLLKLSLR